MSIRIDLHVHTRRHSACSTIDPERLIRQAVKAGLDGLVITEHHYQWPQGELDELAAKSTAPGFLLLSGFEYGSRRGDILIYGLAPEDAEDFAPGMDPGEAIALAQKRGAVCIAAHPTRGAMGFDEEGLLLPFDAIEVQSVNLMLHEQRLAGMVASRLRKPPVAASDAHRLPDVGRYATMFRGPIRSMPDLQAALKRGRFCIGDDASARTGTQ